MPLDYIAPAGRQHSSLKHEVLRLMQHSRIDTRQLVQIGRTLLETGGSQALNLMIDRVADQLGQKAAYELALAWTYVTDHDDVAVEAARFPADDVPPWIR